MFLKWSLPFRDGTVNRAGDRLLLKSSLDSRIIVPELSSATVDPRTRMNPYRIHSRRLIQHEWERKRFQTTRVREKKVPNITSEGEKSFKQHEWVRRFQTTRVREVSNNTSEREEGFKQHEWERKRFQTTRVREEKGFKQHEREKKVLNNTSEREKSFKQHEREREGFKQQEWERKRFQTTRVREKVLNNRREREKKVSNMWAPLYFCRTLPLRADRSLSWRHAHCSVLSWRIAASREQGHRAASTTV